MTQLLLKDTLFFFPSQGGMKAVIWTDVFQSVVILVGLIVVAVVVSPTLIHISH